MDKRLIEKFLNTFPKVGVNRGVVFNSGDYDLSVKSSETQYLHERWEEDGGINWDEWDEFRMSHIIGLQNHHRKVPFEIRLELTVQDNFVGQNKKNSRIEGSIWRKKAGKGKTLSDSQVDLVLDILSEENRESKKIREFVESVKHWEHDPEYFAEL